MNCKIFRLELDRLEKPQHLPPEMLTHAAICSACQQHLEAYQQALAILENDAAPALPVDFNAKILARLEPAFSTAPAAIFNWKRLFVHTGYAFTLGLALWFGFKSFDLRIAQQFLHLPAVQQIQQWLTAIGFMEVLQAFQRFIISVLLVGNGLIEKFFGTQALLRAVNLTLMLLLTFTVAKASVFLESWLRQISRRSS